MQQCNAPHATKAAPPSSRINSLESLCGTLRFYGIFLWDIKSLLTCWHGAEQLSHARGFSLGTFLVSLHVQAHRLTQPPDQQGWDIPVPSASESSNIRHVWWGESTGLSITGKEGLPPTSNSISSPMVPGRYCHQSPVIPQTQVWGPEQRQSWDELGLHNVQRATQLSPEQGMWGLKYSWGGRQGERTISWSIKPR